jgi:protein-L-isoaspartate(D-aspartate) O-methyltransferase
VLEIGTGTGYQAAILAECGFDVYSIEIRPALAERAAELLRELGYGNVRLRCGDGREGWPEAAPFDGIVVAAAPERIPEALLRQLGEAGRLVIPVGTESQELWRYGCTPAGFKGEQLMAVRFVPMSREGD